jgi:hypothetical protein
MALNKREDGIFASVLADGKIHITVPEGTEGSVVRVYETSDGKKGTKTEMVYDDVVGKITRLSFRDGEYGTSLNVEITDGEEKPIVLSLGTASNFGEDFMKKILNVNMDKYVKVAPYTFLDENGKNKKGITIWQKDADNKSYKVENYFYDKEAKAPCNGYPETPVPKKGKTLSSDDWKLFFGIARKFMIEKITEHFKLDEEAVDAVQSEVDAW